MNEKIEIGEVQVERLDDIPVILGHLQKNHIQEIIDQEIEPHGNWEGLSSGMDHHDLVDPHTLGT